MRLALRPFVVNIITLLVGLAQLELLGKIVHGG
jgi:hypothetical protein